MVTPPFSRACIGSSRIITAANVPIHRPGIALTFHKGESGTFDATNVPGQPMLVMNGLFKKRNYFSREGHIPPQRRRAMFSWFQFR
jgi:hypothetical protein